LSVPWADSRPDTSHALNAALIDTTLRAAFFVPPSAARLKTPTWSPAVVDVDLALIATPDETDTETGVVTETGAVMDRSSCPIHFIRRSPDGRRFQSHTAPLQLCGQASAAMTRRPCESRARRPIRSQDIEFFSH
jgi:hypothetical protein